nr:Uncharacterised protein [Klebsiella pneumoniae]
MVPESSHPVMKQGELTHSFLPDSSTQQQIAEVVNG